MDSFDKKLLVQFPQAFKIVGGLIKFIPLDERDSPTFYCSDTESKRKLCSPEFDPYTDDNKVENSKGDLMTFKEDYAESKIISYDLEDEPRDLIIFDGEDDFDSYAGDNKVENNKGDLMTFKEDKNDFLFTSPINTEPQLQAKENGRGSIPHEFHFQGYPQKSSPLKPQIYKPDYVTIQIESVDSTDSLLRSIFEDAKIRWFNFPNSPTEPSYPEGGIICQPSQNLPQNLPQNLDSHPAEMNDEPNGLSGKSAQTDGRISSPHEPGIPDEEMPHLDEVSTEDGSFCENEVVATSFQSDGYPVAGSAESELILIDNSESIIPINKIYHFDKSDNYLSVADIVGSELVSIDKISYSNESDLDITTSAIDLSIKVVNKSGNPISDYESAISCQREIHALTSDLSICAIANKLKFYSCLIIWNEFTIDIVFLKNQRTEPRFKMKLRNLLILQHQSLAAMLHPNNF